MPEPLELSVELDCPADHAFHTWTTRFGQWWPRSHTVSADPETVVLLEPRLGGRIYERAPSGEEHDWGEVTAYDPPNRLSYLWHLRADRTDATDVELTFVPLTDQRCRVDILHTGWERLGAAADTQRDANQAGWSGLLPHFIDAASPRAGEHERQTPP